MKDELIQGCFTVQQIANRISPFLLIQLIEAKTSNFIDGLHMFDVNLIKVNYFVFLERREIIVD